jgi:hypothetical protein
VVAMIMINGDKVVVMDGNSGGSRGLVAVVVW